MFFSALVTPFIGSTYAGILDGIDNKNEKQLVENLFSKNPKARGYAIDELVQSPAQYSNVLKTLLENIGELEKAPLEDFLNVLPEIYGRNPKIFSNEDFTNIFSLTWGAPRSTRKAARDFLKS